MRSNYLIKKKKTELDILMTRFCFKGERSPPPKKGRIRQKSGKKAVNIIVKMAINMFQNVFNLN